MKQKQTSKKIYHTFDEWKELGYGILKGVKSHKINDEFEPMFSNKQVSLYPESYDDGYFDLKCWGDIGDIL